MNLLTTGAHRPQGPAPTLPDPLPMPIVVGSPRSGTTLLRLMLDSHPALAIPPETGFLTLPLDQAGAADAADPRGGFLEAITNYPPEAPGWADFGIDKAAFAQALAQLQPFDAAQGFRLFYQTYAARFGKSRWGDKTPLYGLHLPALQSLLPEARFIHIIRDGRGCATSLRQQWFSPGEAMDVQARYWMHNVATTRAHGARCRHYLELRYEDLIEHTERELRRLCDFIRLDFDPVMLSYHTRSPQRLQEHLGRVGRDGVPIVSQAQRHAQQAMTTRPPDRDHAGAWRQALSAEEIRSFEAVAGGLLASLGYPLLATATPRAQPWATSM